MKSKSDGLKFCAGDCGEGLKVWYKELLRILGDPALYNNQSVLSLLNSINTTLAPEGDIYSLLEDIFDAIPNCISTGTFSADAPVEFTVNQPVRITGIHAFLNEDPDDQAGIIVEIGTMDATDTFTLLNQFVSPNLNPGAGVINFQTNFTYPLLITPPTGERVVVRAYEIGTTPAESIPLNVFYCIDPQ
ncbi:MAG: hypothetical protein PWP07_254 [Epulopiscium sp.]|mgnify:FL=1|jgi:predicted RNA binding protein with dsRBD fold (UPF0201 family)|uniref:Uncharacterized protein n=1 Tax=Defluviitalea raffinosedens TaxID=1450156 RepID=A0A7C8HEQ7_9FIRM|nr:hypothetical protein [Defluviitalea raffinosedens]KAE9634467.1 hypothetical protein GND95_07280 [Defluviitalea raffinosedens]MBM7684738.1 putative RNA binding protein with dsRBD fold (UPF0201 family) [Defluviitalea raffinosedens]MBZ4668246.1 hypothetical protein [Defluviitaleaceae bacterium]MDK2787029.1 hypothetical protein [Candidatus Epulonipiscium sp.]